MEEITAAELHERLGEDGLRIVDIRGESSFARQHIPGSENVPFPELPNRIEQFDGAEQVVTVCPIGESSIQAARLIESYEGVDGDVASLAGGIEGWGFETDSGIERDTDEGPEAPF